MTGFDAGRLAAIDRFVAVRHLDMGEPPCAQPLVARGGEIAHFSHDPGFAEQPPSHPPRVEDDDLRGFDMTFLSSPRLKAV